MYPISHARRLAVGEGGTGAGERLGARDPYTCLSALSVTPTNSQRSVATGFGMGALETRHDTDLLGVLLFEALDLLLQLARLLPQPFPPEPSAHPGYPEVIDRSGTIDDRSAHRQMTTCRPASLPSAARNRSRAAASASPPVPPSPSAPTRRRSPINSSLWGGERVPLDDGGTHLSAHAGDDGPHHPVALLPRAGQRQVGVLQRVRAERQRVEARPERVVLQRELFRGLRRWRSCRRSAKWTQPEKV